MFATNFDDMTEDSFHHEPRNAQGRKAGDDRLHVTFYKRPVKSEPKSIEAGRSIFDEIDFIKISIPGDQFNTIDNYASDEYKARFPNDWTSYTNKTTMGSVGTPLEHWKGLNSAQVMEFKSMNVRTVEELVDLPDSFSTKIMGILALKAKARLFIDSSKEEAINTKAVETNTRLVQLEQERNAKDAEVEMLKTQMATLMKKLDKTSSKTSE